MAEPADCFAISAPGIEAVTAAELAALGATIDETEPGGVSFLADAALLYRANLELRTASRVVKRIATFEARTWFELERHGKKIAWRELLGAGMVPEFEVTSRKSKLYHNRGIAERLERIAGAEEKAAAVDPARVARVQVRAVRDRFTLSLDASGELLHRRGYRLETAKAPLRETLAAAMLLGCGWDGSIPLADPFCGSGTIPIEAALIARKIAPGLHRRFAFESWPDFDATLWREIRAAAESRIVPGSSRIIGSDRDAGAIEASRANAARAGVLESIDFRNASLSAMDAAPGAGLLLTNPPYGARIGEEKPLRNLYAQLGNVARTRLPGWRVALLGANPRLEGQVGLPLEEIWRTNNGGIPVHLVASRASLVTRPGVGKLAAHIGGESMSETTAPEGLAGRLREATGAAHTAAERTAFVKHLFKGTLPREGYVGLIRALHPVYVALEAAMGANKDDAAVGMVYDPALNRAASLEQDLEFFAGKDWKAIPVVKAASDYAGHLTALGKTMPRGLVAHAYVRYLGDLSGGQMMGRSVAKTYEAGEAGTNFYNFRDVTDVNGRKNTYRAALSALPLTPQEQDEVVGEAITGFDYAKRMFEDLDKAYPTT